MRYPLQDGNGVIVEGLDSLAHGLLVVVGASARLRAAAHARQHRVVRHPVRHAQPTLMNLSLKLVDKIKESKRASVFKLFNKW